VAAGAVVHVFLGRRFVAMTSKRQNAKTPRVFDALAILARLYEVPTRAPNQAVRRNIERFPEDFAFHWKIGGHNL
jgi:hypothetical protein